MVMETIADTNETDAERRTTSDPGPTRRQPRAGPSSEVLFTVVGVLGIAAVLRVTGLKFGLPAVYNPDEIAIMSRALAFATGDLNPHNFLYPTFYFYVLFGWVGLSFVVSWMAGVVPSLAAFEAQFFTDPTNIYLAGRLLTVVCAGATVVLTYVLGARLLSGQAGRMIGMAAAVFLAVAPTHVRDSHYVKHDIPATLTIVIAQLAILRLLKTRDDDDVWTRLATAPPTRGGSVHAMLAGAACGVAFSTHYYAVFLALPLMLAAVLREREHGWRRVVRTTAIAFVTSAVVFFALSPFLLAEPRTAWRDIVANRQIVVDRAIDTQHLLFANTGIYARMLWSDAIGWPVALAALIGAVWLARDRSTQALVLLAFPLAFFAFISNTVAASRYLNPILPTLAVLAGYAVARITASNFLRMVLILAISVPGLMLSRNLIWLFFQNEDTRSGMQRALERDLPPGTTVLVQPYSVQLTQSRDSLVEALEAHLGDARRASTKFARRLALDPYPSPAFRTLFLGDGGLDVDKIYLTYRDVAEPEGIDVLRRAGVQYVVLKRYNVEDPAAVPLRRQLQQEASLIYTISPYAKGVDEATRARVAPFLHNTDTPYDAALQLPGPGIEVWKIPMTERDKEAFAEREIVRRLFKRAVPSAPGSTGDDRR